MHIEISALIVDRFEYDISKGDVYIYLKPCEHIGIQQVITVDIENDIYIRDQKVIIEC